MERRPEGVVVEPTQRISYQSAWEGGVVRNTPVYTCPYCYSAVGFSNENFLDHGEHPRSDLSNEINLVFDAIRPLQKSPSLPYSDDNEYFLDFSCECGLQVRIIYNLQWLSFGKADWRDGQIVVIVESNPDK